MENQLVLLPQSGAPSLNLPTAVLEAFDKDKRGNSPCFSAVSNQHMDGEREEKKMSSTPMALAQGLDTNIRVTVSRKNHHTETFASAGDFTPTRRTRRSTAPIPISASTTSKDDGFSSFQQSESLRIDYQPEKVPDSPLPEIGPAPEPRDKDKQRSSPCFSEVSNQHVDGEHNEKKTSETPIAVPQVLSTSLDEGFGSFQTHQQSESLTLAELAEALPRSEEFGIEPVFDKNDLIDFEVLEYDEADDWDEPIFDIDDLADFSIDDEETLYYPYEGYEDVNDEEDHCWKYFEKPTDCIDYVKRNFLLASNNPLEYIFNVFDRQLFGNMLQKTKISIRFAAWADGLGAEAVIQKTADAFSVKIHPALKQIDDEATLNHLLFVVLYAYVFIMSDNNCISKTSLYHHSEIFKKTLKKHLKTLGIRKRKPRCFQIAYSTGDKLSVLHSRTKRSEEQEENCELSKFNLNSIIVKNDILQDLVLYFDRILFDGAIQRLQQVTPNDKYDVAFVNLELLGQHNAHGLLQMFGQKFIITLNDELSIINNDADLHLLLYTKLHLLGHVFMSIKEHSESNSMYDHGSTFEVGVEKMCNEIGIPIRVAVPGCRPVVSQNEEFLVISSYELSYKALIDNCELVVNQAFLAELKALIPQKDPELLSTAEGDDILQHLAKQFDRCMFQGQLQQFVERKNGQFCINFVESAQMGGDQVDGFTKQSGRYSTISINQRLMDFSTDEKILTLLFVLQHELLHPFQNRHKLDQKELSNDGHGPLFEKTLRKLCQMTKIPRRQESRETKKTAQKRRLPPPLRNGTIRKQPRRRCHH